ncbi:MAG: glycine--tRNA ligase subunit beta [Rhodobacteraceae bacterium]|jgi:glycyl-tRNA synthetase beta chain|uniref:glycine--tRNA ligase subunit beta n=1 Tax=Roseovarius sp. 10 TaxID=3080563 RepID=UPI001938FEA6|nr:glycine--tRNA ligase subunit beta [Roseovarius sp. 10]MBE1290449.1 glycine--tRNA ligase subunit beta [Paracoccaceae bacterium]MDV7201219.1 glycine--tRNA ligase subunit beta [Roseovarius sp. 10]QPI86288.1 glycine--tRNA ligase subunit beta [Rhodobacterales bacterium HKCCA1288]
MPDLLLELFSEEIPARMQAKAAEDLKSLVTNGLVEAGLTYASAASFATPRRLCLVVDGLSANSPTTTEERKGPRVDAPEAAIEGFLRGAGVSRDALETREDKKGEIYVARITHQGRDAADIISELVPSVIRNFPWPKSMRWGAGSLRWVRPLHSILCLLTDEAGAGVVPFEVDDIVAGDKTRGHRFMAPDAFAVSSFEDYEAKLKRAHVILRANERADAIWHEASQMAFAAGLELVEDRGLLAEVAGLVEWPVVLMGEIGADFLNLPPEVLQTSMKEHQKFFSVKNPKTGRIERFVTVANRITADEGATILAGNQKVLSARLSDAKFFWENDLRVAKSDITQWTQSLENVTFQAKLGSQAARIERIAELAAELAPIVGADADQARQAAKIAKADLSSEMVYEFPELQGLMGRYYAAEAGCAPEIAAVAQEHYQPLGPSDDVPNAPLSVAVALADKIDTLTGFWAIDEKPTGSKDPYALRRAALGVIRLILDNGVRLNLSVPFVSRGAGFGSDAPEAAAADLLSFFHDRLKVHLRDEGIRHDVIDACLSMAGNDDLALVVARARAVQAVLSTDDGENLIQGYRRANNILTQAEAKDGVEYRFGADMKFAETEEERALFAALAAARDAANPALASEDFATAMAALAALRGPIDAFFEKVQVNADSEIVRRNRLNLLHEIVETCGKVADLSRIEG